MGNIESMLQNYSEIGARNAKVGMLLQNLELTVERMFSVLPIHSCIFHCLQDCHLSTTIDKCVEELLRNPKKIKSDLKAQLLRKEGNVAFQKKNWQDALTRYNDSVVYASTDKELALDFANRSAVFFEIGNYKMCLENIRQALSHGYDPSLKYKLYKRQALSYQKLGLLESALEAAALTQRAIGLSNVKSKQRDDLLKDLKPLLEKTAIKKQTSVKTVSDVSSEYKLADGKNPKVPSLSAAADVMLDRTNKGRFVVAKRNVEPGEVLLFERPYVISLEKKLADSHCWNCARHVECAIPCSMCSEIRYCSEICKDEAWLRYHSHECGLMESLDVLGSFVLPMRMIQKSGLTKVLEFQLQFPKEPPFAVQGFNKDGIYDPDDYYTACFLWDFEAYKIEALPKLKSNLVLMSVLASKFYNASTKQGLALMDLKRLAVMFFFHVLQVGANTCEITFWKPYKTKCMPVVEEKKLVVGLAISLTYSLINHSCDPNAMFFPVDDSIMIRASKKIRKGEEICISYLHNQKGSRDLVKIMYGFDCNCISCTSNTFSGVNFSHSFTASQFDSVNSLLETGRYMFGLELAYKILFSLSDKPLVVDLFHQAHTVVQICVSQMVCQCETDRYELASPHEECIYNRKSFRFASGKDVRRVFEILEASVTLLKPSYAYNGVATYWLFNGVLRYAFIASRLFTEKPETVKDEKCRGLAVKLLTMVQEINKAPKNLYTRFNVGKELEEALESVINGTSEFTVK